MMLLRQNVSAFLSNYAKERNQEASAQELGISRASLHAIFKGSCNPRLSTLEKVADHLDIIPVLLLCYGGTEAELETLRLLPELLSKLLSLPSDKRRKFAALLAAMTRLWSESRA